MVSATENKIRGASYDTLLVALSKTSMDRLALVPDISVWGQRPVRVSQRMLGMWDNQKKVDIMKPWQYALGTWVVSALGVVLSATGHPVTSIAVLLLATFGFIKLIQKRLEK